MSSRVFSRTIHALTAGENGSPIIFVSGWPETSRAFLPLFHLLDSKHRLFALDPPGLGDSAPPLNGDYSTVSISKIMHDAVSSELREPFHLVGHDVGAWIVYPWAHRFPESVLSVAFIDGAVPGLAGPNNFPLPASLNLKLWQFSFNALPGLPEILTEGRERPLLNWLFDHKAVQRDRIKENVRNAYIDCYSRPGAMSRGFAYYRMVATSAQQNTKLADQGKLKAPVIAIAGDAGVGEGMKTAIQSVTTDKFTSIVVDNCGHFVMEEQPERTAEILLQHFEDVDNSVAIKS